MAEERRPDSKRAEVSFIFAIVIGLALGILIKKIRIGMMIGLVLGILIVMSGWLRTTRNK